MSIARQVALPKGQPSKAHLIFIRLESVSATGRMVKQLEHCRGESRGDSRIVDQIGIAGAARLASLACVRLSSTPSPTSVYVNPKSLPLSAVFVKHHEIGKRDESSFVIRLSSPWEAGLPHMNQIPSSRPKRSGVEGPFFNALAAAFRGRQVPRLRSGRRKDIRTAGFTRVEELARPQTLESRMFSLFGGHKMQPVAPSSRLARGNPALQRNGVEGPFFKALAGGNSRKQGPSTTLGTTERGFRSSRSFRSGSVQRSGALERPHVPASARTTSGAGWRFGLPGLRQIPPGCNDVARV
jgi:hypothetical protein